MINAGQPVEELAEAVFGHPFHGFVRGGVLVLPNGTNMTYRQPIGGNTYVYKKPGIAVITRSPADQITDTASGFQWRNYAIMSGLDCQLYGKAIGAYGYLNWIYLAADGSRWNISMANPTLTYNAGPWVFNFTVSRFGEFGAAAESYSLSSTLTDIGQHIDSTSNLDRMGLYVNAHSTVIKTQMTTGLMVLSDVKPDGSEAILGLDSFINPDVIANGDMPTYMGDQGMPVGFLSVNLTGSGSSLSVSVSVLYTRAQCMPVIKVDGVAETYNGTIQPLPLAALGIPAAGTGHGYGIPGTADYIGRIVAVWYDQSGIPHPVTIDKNYSAVFVGWSSSQSYDPVTSQIIPSDCENNVGASATGTGFSVYTLKFNSTASSVTFTTSNTIICQVSISFARSCVGSFWQYNQLISNPGVQGAPYCDVMSYAGYMKWTPGPLTPFGDTWSSTPYAEYPGGLLPLYDQILYQGIPPFVTQINEIYYRRLSNRCLAIMGKHNSGGDDAIIAMLTPDGKPTSITLYTGAGVGTSSTIPLPSNLGMLLPNSVPVTSVDPGTTTVALDTSNNQICYV